MDNVTHSLVGVALADAITGSATKSRRPLYVGAGVIAANLPDIDIAYSAMTPAPLGYLLHHRGHTHTIAGLGLLVLVLILTYRLLPPVRAMRATERLRLFLVIAAALASHLSMDALNSYGVHPFYPIDNHWYYGDAVFIFEPSLWLVLGVAVAWNGRSGASRLAVALPMLLLIVTIASMDIVPLESSAVLGVIGVWFAWGAKRMSPRARAGAALVATTFVVVVLVAVSRGARAESRQALQPHVRGRLVDIILTPNPASPLCWGVIAVELNEADNEYVLWRGTLSLAPQLKAPTACASHRFAEAGETRRTGAGDLVMHTEIRRSLRELRKRSRQDCWTRAWLRFGRAPVLTRQEIFDLRFAERGTQNLTHMSLTRAPSDRSCPTFVPDWGMPRADLLAGHE